MKLCTDREVISDFCHLHKILTYDNKNTPRVKNTWH